MEMGLSDDLKANRLLKFMNELSSYKGVSLLNALFPDEYHILLKYQGKNMCKMTFDHYSYFFKWTSTAHAYSMRSSSRFTPITSSSGACTLSLT